MSSGGISASVAIARSVFDTIGVRTRKISLSFGCCPQCIGPSRQAGHPKPNTSTTTSMSLGLKAI